MNHQFVRLSEETKHLRSKFSDNFESFGKCRFEDSLLYGGLVSESVITDSSSSSYPLITNSTVIKSHIGGLSFIGHSKVAKFFSTGKIRVVNSFGIDVWMEDFSIVENAKVFHTLLQDNATVKGGKVVGKRDEKIILGGSTVIDRGVWKVAPLNYTSPNGISITENVGNLVTVSCITNTCEKWLGGAGRRYGRMLGFTKEDTDFIEDRVYQIGQWQEECRVWGISNSILREKEYWLRKENLVEKLD